MNTSRSHDALFDDHATHSNHDMFHTADKTDTRRNSLAGRKTTSKRLTHGAILRTLDETDSSERSDTPYDRLEAKETQKDSKRTK